MPESSCCQEDGDACGPFIDQEREIERLRGALKTIMLDCASASKDANYCPAAQRAFQSTSNFARAYV